jgi:DNA-binding protein HU-beta
MNIGELAEQTAEASGLSKVKLKRVLEVVLGAIVEATAAGQEITLPNFGKFKIKTVPAHTGRNPATGEPIDIPETKKLAYIQNKTVKDRLNPAS